MSPAAHNLLRALELAAPFLIIGLFVGIFWPEKRRSQVPRWPSASVGSREDGEFGFLLASRLPMPDEKVELIPMQKSIFRTEGPLRWAITRTTRTGPLMTGTEELPTQKRVPAA
jgi:hypothetical protein